MTVYRLHWSDAEYEARLQALLVKHAGTTLSPEGGVAPIARLTSYQASQKMRKVLSCIFLLGLGWAGLLRAEDGISADEVVSPHSKTGASMLGL